MDDEVVRGRNENCKERDVSMRVSRWILYRKGEQVGKEGRHTQHILNVNEETQSKLYI